MKFARIVFSTAGALGILAMIPMYLAPGSYRYYGSLGGLVAWQFAFFVIATDPKRYRLIMIPALMEKLLWVLPLSHLPSGTDDFSRGIGRYDPSRLAGGAVRNSILQNPAASFHRRKPPEAGRLIAVSH